MKKATILLFALLSAVAMMATKPRVLISTDIGGTDFYLCMLESEQV